MMNSGKNIMRSPNISRNHHNIDKFMTPKPEHKMTTKAMSKISPSPGSKVYCERVTLRNNRSFTFT